MSASDVSEAGQVCEATANEALPDAEIYCPILRYGHIVSALHEGRAFGFPYWQMDNAIAALTAKSETFTALLTDYFEAPSRGWKVETGVGDLTGTKVARKLGAVVDFPELRVTKDGCTDFVRLSVTICVDRKGVLAPMAQPDELKATDHFRYLDDGVRLNSKLWVRTANAEFEGQAICEKDAKSSLEFTEEFEEFSEDILNLIAPAYLGVLADLSQLPVTEVELRVRERISNLTVSAIDPTLRSLNDQIQHGDFDSDNCNSLRQTGYFSVFNGIFDHLNKDGAGPVVGCTDLYALDARFTKGVYVAQIKPEMTRFFGAAQSPYWDGLSDDGGQQQGLWKFSPGNALGAIAMTGIAARF